MSLLGERLVAVHRAFSIAELPHAVGGAIALGYCTEEPRGTRDLDVNVFVGMERGDEVLDALPNEVRITETNRRTMRRDGQVRVFWDDTPVDLFLDAHRIQEEAAERVRHVHFEGTTIPVLGCEDLARFKALFGRPRDWADIAEMLRAAAIDGPAIVDDLRTLLGPLDPTVRRFAELLA